MPWVREEPLDVQIDEQRVLSLLDERDDARRYETEARKAFVPPHRVHFDRKKERMSVARSTSFE